MVVHITDVTTAKRVSKVNYQQTDQLINPLKQTMDKKTNQFIPDMEYLRLHFHPIHGSILDKVGTDVINLLHNKIWFPINNIINPIYSDTIQN